MNQEKDQVDELYKFLRSLHRSKLGELEEKGKMFAKYLNLLNGFEIVDAETPHKHVGAVIIDGVLQVGKDYEKLVRPAVDKILKYEEARTVSGFIRLLSENELGRLINFKTPKTKYDLLRVANFFANKELDTFAQLYDWLKPEEHRDQLLAMKHDPNGAIFSVADKTADYFRRVVGHWDAVAVDTNTRRLLDRAGIVSMYSHKYEYKEKRTIVQLAALNLKHWPIDLDASIYKDSVRNSWRYKSKPNKIPQSHSDIHKRGGNMTGEGGEMDKNNKDSMLEVLLPSQKMRHLETVAQEFDVDKATLAKIWIIDRLQQYGAQEPAEPMSHEGENSPQNTEIIITGKVVAPDDKQGGPRREISIINKGKTQRVTCEGGPLDVSTAEHKFGARWSKNGTVLLIPVKLSIGPVEYDATLHYEQDLWIGSPLNDGQVKLAEPLAREDLNKGDEVNLRVRGNNIQVV